MLIRALLAILAAAALIGGPEARADDVLIAATLDDFPPYCGQALPNFGFSNDLVVQAMGRTGHKVTVVFVPWARALSGAMDGYYDILPSVWYSPERGNALLFSEPYVVSRLVFVTRKDSPFDYTRLEDLAGKTVGIVNGYEYGKAFRTSTLFTRDVANSTVLNLTRVAAGRIDLTVEDELTLRYLFKTTALDLANRLVLSRGALSEQEMHMAVSKKRVDAGRLVADFNQGLAQMKQDGSYDALLVVHKLDQPRDAE